MRLTQIDETNRGDHHHLTQADTCYYLFEYTSGRRYDFSRTNQLISNLKKKPSLRDRADYRYKGKAISDCATFLRASLNPGWLQSATLVPVPPSKATGHADYDDRMETVCRRLGPNVDVRALVTQSVSTAASHEAAAGDRVTVADLLGIYSINEALAEPTPTALAIVDDVLTAGTHYRAMHSVLRERFSGVPIVGIFIARRVFPAPVGDFDDLGL